MSKSLPDLLKKMPHKPGIYQMCDAQGKTIYVGKARDLKKRLSSYFRSSALTGKTQVMMKKVVDIKITLAADENDALLLEANLIKQYKPRYNILLRDDKSYPYLLLTTHENFPRLDFYRGSRRQAGRYFGPYPHARAVRDSLNLIQKLFKLRQCSASFFANRSRPCLQYQIKRCSAPCVAYVTEEQYQEQVASALLFLEGKSEKIIAQLTQQMEQASKKLEYERARECRDQIANLREVQKQQTVMADVGDVDVIGCAYRQGRAVLSVLFIRAGRVLGQRTFMPRLPEQVDAATTLSAFLSQYYLSPMRGDIIPQQIMLSEKIADKAWMQAGLEKALQQKLRIYDDRRGKKKAWIEMAMANAEHVLVQHFTQQNVMVDQFSALEKKLQAPNAFKRIECFDVSHTHGKQTVASCVVCARDGLHNASYRRFNIKDVTPGDDYAALRQALMRHYKRMKQAGADLPDLLLIDGGKGQLSSALAAMEELQISGVMVLAIAKGRARKAGQEQLFLANKELGRLPPESPALHLLQVIRDEAHRFAITGHRQRRAKVITHSRLEDIPGIGAKRRKLLLSHFGGLQQLRQASVDDIAKVPGMNIALAKRVYEALLS